MKQQTHALFRIIQLFKSDFKGLASEKLERWAEVLFKTRAVARLTKDLVHFFVQKGSEMIIGCQSFYAAEVFRRLLSMRPRSVILTSGTLTPFSEIESELNLYFPIKLVNDHVIDGRNAVSYTHLTLPTKRIV